MTDHYVYRAFDLEGQLLYVGVTGNLKRRMTSHRYMSEWWPLAARIDHDGPMVPDAAFASERLCIEQYAPRFNRQPGRRAAPAAPPRSGGHRNNFTLRLSPEMVATIEDLAEEEQRTFSDMARILLGEAVAARAKAKR